MPDFEATKPPSYRPPEDAVGPAALRGDDPFIMQADGKGWLFVPNGLQDGPMPTHYEPHESPFRNALYGQQGNPTRKVYGRDDNPSNPSPPEAHSEVFPHVLFTSRLTEHHTAGGMSRNLPFLSELQPEMFVEVSPAAAPSRSGSTHLGWATLVSSRSAIEARVLVTERLRPLRVQDRLVHQVWVPYHWGYTGLVTGDAANDLFGIVLDPNVLIQESKVITVDVRPGRRPRGKDLLALVADYRQRAGITRATGTAITTTGPGARQAAPGDRARPGGIPWLTSIRVFGPADRPGRRLGLRRRPPAAQGVLHRHLDLHRLQGLRGRLQAVERRAGRRLRPARHVVRQHRGAGRLDLAARRVH